MMKIQLNGWQRLWVLLGVIYLVAIVIVTYSVIPKHSQILSSWAYDIIDQIKTHEKLDTYNWTLRNEIFGDKSDKDIVEGTNRKAANSNDKEWQRTVQELEKKYKKQFDGLPKEQMETIGIASLVWAGSMAFLYALGFGIGWVYRGFRKK